jgi:hypothetical protein
LVCEKGQEGREGEECRDNCDGTGWCGASLSDDKRRAGEAAGLRAGGRQARRIMRIGGS